MPPPPARPRLAILFAGKVGDTSRVPGWTPYRELRSSKGALPSVAMLAAAAASIVQHVVEANADAFDTECLGHSWHPELSEALDALFALRRSLHEPMLFSRTAAKSAAGRAAAAAANCTAAAFPRYALHCTRTYSQLLGIGRALELKRLEEASRGFTYDAVMLSRWDILWHRPLLLPRLPRWASAAEGRRGLAWLPRHCIHQRDDDPSGEAARRAGSPTKWQVCGGGASDWKASQAAVLCDGRREKPCNTNQYTLHAREVFVLDWWLVLGTSADADRFGAMAATFVPLREAMARLSIRPSAEPLLMGHLMWGAQLKDVMGATLLFSDAHARVDFHLARAWDDWECLATRPTCKASACGTADLLRPHWQSLPPYEGALRPGHDSAFHRASDMQHSCNDGFFLCSRTSRMCREAEERSWPMDRRAPHALFLACASNSSCDSRYLLPRSTQGAAAAAGVTGGPPPYPGSAACAGWLLDLWRRVWEAQPPPRLAPDSGGPQRTLGMQHAAKAYAEAGARAYEVISARARQLYNASPGIGPSGPPAGGRPAHVAGDRRGPAASEVDVGATCEAAWRVSAGGRGRLSGDVTALVPGSCAPLSSPPPGASSLASSWGNCSSLERDAEGGWLLHVLSRRAARGAEEGTHAQAVGIGMGTGTGSGLQGYEQASTPALTWCAALCASCARCAFISVSEARRECRWYAACDPRNLSSPAAALGFGTSAGRSPAATAAAAAAAASSRVNRSPRHRQHG